ncbi:MAG: ATP-binding protein, partial [Candidatus Micrarchaeota archaeon]
SDIFGGAHGDSYKQAYLSPQDMSKNTYTISFESDKYGNTISTKDAWRGRQFTVLTHPELITPNPDLSYKYINATSGQVRSYDPQEFHAASDSFMQSWGGMALNTAMLAALFEPATAPLANIYFALNSANSLGERMSQISSQGEANTANIVGLSVDMFMLYTCARGLGAFSNFAAPSTLGEGILELGAGAKMVQAADLISHAGLQIDLAFSTAAAFAGLTFSNKIDPQELGSIASVWAGVIMGSRLSSVRKSLSSSDAAVRQKAIEQAYTKSAGDIPSLVEALRGDANLMKQFEKISSGIIRENAGAEQRFSSLFEAGELYSQAMSPKEPKGRYKSAAAKDGGEEAKIYVKPTSTVAKGKPKSVEGLDIELMKQGFRHDLKNLIDDAPNLCELSQMALNFCGQGELASHFKTLASDLRLKSEGATGHFKVLKDSAPNSKEALKSIEELKKLSLEVQKICEQSITPLKEVIAKNKNGEIYISKEDLSDLNASIEGFGRDASSIRLKLGKLSYYANYGEGTYTPTMEAADIRAQCIETCNSAKSRAVKLSLEISDLACVANVDMNLLDTALANVVANAFKYAKSEVLVRIYAKGKWIHIEVENDVQPGKALKSRQEAANSFSGVKNQNATDNSTRFGMPASKKIVEDVFGGQIGMLKLGNDGLGRKRAENTAFEIKLPTAKARRADETNFLNSLSMSIIPGFNLNLFKKAYGKNPPQDKGKIFDKTEGNKTSVPKKPTFYPPYSQGSQNAPAGATQTTYAPKRPYAPNFQTGRKEPESSNVPNFQTVHQEPEFSSQTKTFQFSQNVL